MRLFLLATACAFSTAAFAFQPPIVIGHRGASGYRPEHTLESYRLAIDMGADFIEPDLVMTKDGVLVARHENEISGTTDVAEKFPKLKTTKLVDGKEVTGWFVEDLTLKELKTLRAKERLEFRKHDNDGKFEIPTFDEILEFVKGQSKARQHVIGVYPETKHPSYFRSIGLPLEKKLIKALAKYGLNKKDSPVFIQSFELENLKMLRKMTKARLIYLLDDQKPLPSLTGLNAFVDGIGPAKTFIVPVKDGKKLPPTLLVADAHAAGLLVHPYTFRNETNFLHADYKGDPQKEYLEFFKLGVDGVFSDFPDVAVSARETFLKEQGNKK